MENSVFDIIAVSPHPDDAEIGCGGTLALLSDMGFKIAIIDLTDGEPTPFNENPQIRLDEASRAAKILGVKRVTLELPNRKLFDNIESRLTLAKVFRKFRPKIVIGVQGVLSKWEEHFDGLAPWRISQVFYYYTARELFKQNLPLQFTVDISDVFEKKKKALLEYKSQFRAHKSYNPPIVDWIEGMGRYFGSLAGCKYAEIFYGSKILKLNLFKLFLK
ncbi:MAG: PIG-L family deacetylase [Candidatus Hodarchaeales archaeon]|jgi:LmbE family N-acetylglucosaminyl deacetylase